MAGKVPTHQLNAENPQTVERTPDNYAEHVKEFVKTFGQFEFKITELLAQDNKVCVR